jgi:prevent-host-death family protein
MTTSKASTVGVRELRQNLSVYLVRVEAGEALRVTDRGRVVALLSPLPADATPMDALIAGGRATGRLGNLGDLGPPTGRPSNQTTTTLLTMRDEERY